MKIQLQKIFTTKNLNFFGKNYVDVKLKIRLFCGFRPYGFENRGGFRGVSGENLGCTLAKKGFHDWSHKLCLQPNCRMELLGHCHIWKSIWFWRSLFTTHIILTSGARDEEGLSRSRFHQKLGNTKNYGSVCSFAVTMSGMQWKNPPSLSLVPPWYP